MRRVNVWVLLLVLAVLLPGCGKSQKRCFPVKGQLFIATKPAENALVIFTPLQDAEPAQWPAGYPRGNVSADGAFQLMTYGDNDGAPAGEYAVTVLWMQKTTEGDQAEVDVLQGRYADPTASKLRATVKAETAGNQLEAFHLD